jgi:hypothetical protein
MSRSKHELKQMGSLPAAASSSVGKATAHQSTAGCTWDAR